MRISEKTKEDLQREKKAEKERLIREKIREIAIKELEKEGKL